MQYHQVPPDTRDKEKIFGGIFTLTQFAFLIAGFIIGAGMGLLANMLFKNAASVITAFGISVAAVLPFAFIKIRSMGDVELFQYLMFKVKYNKRVKHMSHVNMNYGGK